jgi:hypothetical protein
MPTALVEIRDMDKKQPKTTPIRITDEAIRWVRIASGYTGESAAEYASRVLAEHSRIDADRLHAEANAPAKGTRTTKGKGEPKT